LIERDVKLFFSGKICGGGDEELKVDKIPIKAWRKVEDNMMLMSLQDDIFVEYQVHSTSMVYKSALKKMCFVDTVDIEDDDDEIVEIGNKMVSPPKRRKLNSVDPKLLAVLSSINKHPSASKPKPKATIVNISAKKVNKPSRPNKSFEEPKRSNKRSDDSIEVVLDSFGAKPGFGDKLKRLLPPEFRDNSDAVACFLMFINERQNVWFRKYHGKTPYTDNEVLSTKWFTNMYREVDRGTQYFRKCLLETTLADHKVSSSGDIDEKIVRKVLFKSVIYRIINEVKTFKAH